MYPWKLKLFAERKEKFKIINNPTVTTLICNYDDFKEMMRSAGIPDGALQINHDNYHDIKITNPETQQSRLFHLVDYTILPNLPDRLKSYQPKYVLTTRELDIELLLV